MRSNDTEGIPLYLEVFVPILLGTEQLLKEKIFIRKKNRQMHQWGGQGNCSDFLSRSNAIQ